MTDIVSLIRPRVSLAVAGGSLFGALYYGGPDLTNGGLTALGAGVLCASCSGLNQVQERELDARMERTRSRPVASGAVGVMPALAISLVLCVVGLAFFFVAGGWPLFLLGLAVPVIYNGLYTPLKRVTPMALLVGGVSGAMPPLTGWVGAGGSVTDPAILGVTTIFFLWQVPHFWLLHQKYRDDYERAGFPTLEGRLPLGMYKPMLCLWVSAYFLGLGCLVMASGPGAVSWLAPPALMLMAGWSLFSVAREWRRSASISVYASLPLILMILLSNTL